MVWKNLGLRNFAKENRRDATPAETRMRYALRDKDLPHFKRQQIIGNYIVDFVSLRHKLIIECDGATHDSDRAQKYDEWRDSFLESQGFTVLRFSNSEIMKNTDSVIEQIKSTLSKKI